jgi:hypothetical protein
LDGGGLEVDEDEDDEDDDDDDEFDGGTEAWLCIVVRTPSALPVSDIEELELDLEIEAEAEPLPSPIVAMSSRGRCIREGPASFVLSLPAEDGGGIAHKSLF